jgi:hypothetical protein
MNTRHLRVGGAALTAAAALAALVAFATTAFAPRDVRAAGPTSTVMAPPACSCSEPVPALGQQIQNCMCGALQCVGIGAKGGTPALVCVK